MLPDFKDYNKSTAIKRVWYWGENRQTDQGNKIESPQIYPHTYSQLIFNKRAKTIQWNKDHLFNKWYWKNWTSTCKKRK